MTGNTTAMAVGVSLHLFWCPLGLFSSGLVCFVLAVRCGSLPELLSSIFIMRKSVENLRPGVLEAHRQNCFPDLVNLPDFGCHSEVNCNKLNGPVTARFDVSKETLSVVNH